MRMSEGTLRTAGFHHVGLIGADAERSVEFYNGILGLPIAARASERILLGDGPGRWLEVAVEPASPRGRWGVGGVHHVALGVSTKNAQLKWKRRLLDAGAKVSGPFDRGWFHSIYFTDPDGQVLEIATAGPGYALDEPADRLGQNVVMPRPEQIRGNRDEEAISALVHADPVPDVTADMQLDGIHHVTGLSADIAGADNQLTEVFGLSLIKRTVNQDDGRTPHLFWARYDPPEVAPHSSYTLFDWTGSTYRVRPGTGQTERVAFRAADSAELNAWREQLLLRGSEVGPVLDGEFFRSFTFRAPDGQSMAVALDAPI